MNRNNPHFKLIMDEFRSYNVAELTEFLRRTGRPLAGIRKNLVGRVKDMALGKDTPPHRPVPDKEYLNYIDELKENGNQHLFLFSLSDDEIESLRGPQDLSRRIEKAGFTLGTSRTIWRTLKPKLAAALSGNSPLLLLKWVHSRKWNVVDGEPPNEERAVTFFRLDLDSGDAELRIQALKTYPQKSLREEFETYLNLLKELLNLPQLECLPLGPAVKRLLTTPDSRMRVSRWEVGVGASEALAFRGSPSFMRQLGFHFQKRVGVRLEGGWRLRDSNRAWLLFDINAKKNAIKVRGRCSGADLNGFLECVRSGRWGNADIAELESLAKEREAWRSIIYKLDTRISREGKHEFKLDELAYDSWSSPDRVLEIMTAAAARFPENFKIRRYVLCPQAGRSVRHGGTDTSFNVNEPIPAEIPCQHRRPTWDHTVNTAGNIYYQIDYTPQIEAIGILPYIRPRMLRHLKPEQYESLMEWLPRVLFAVLLMILFALNALIYAALAERFPSSRRLLHLFALPVVLLNMGIVVIVLGPPVTDKAISVLEKLMEAFGRLIAKLQKLVRDVERILKYLFERWSSPHEKVAKADPTLHKSDTSTHPRKGKPPRKKVAKTGPPLRKSDISTHPRKGKPPRKAALPNKSKMWETRQKEKGKRPEQKSRGRKQEL